MQDLVTRGGSDALAVEVDEALARRELRRQIGRLERRLAGLVGEGFGRVAVEHHLSPRPQVPHLLDLGELERLRDELAERIAGAEVTLARRAEVETANREMLERMLDDPAGYRWVRISRADVGEPGCGGWHSQPRLGPLGMLMGWWRVKVSSGCPLAGRLAAVEQEAQAQGAAPAPAAVRDEGGRGDRGGNASEAHSGEAAAERRRPAAGPVGQGAAGGARDPRRDRGACLGPDRR
jgi:hypothetical protein